MEMGFIPSFGKDLEEVLGKDSQTLGKNSTGAGKSGFPDPAHPRPRRTYLVTVIEVELFLEEVSQTVAEIVWLPLETFREFQLHV